MSKFFRMLFSLIALKFVKRNKSFRDENISYICPHCGYENNDFQVCDCVSCACGRLSISECEGCIDGDASCEVHCVCPEGDF